MVKLVTGKRIGLVIGNNYQKSNNELKFSVADASKIKEILENKNICGFDEVVYLQDKTSKDASTAIERILKNADGDLIFIYFSGHGITDFEHNLCLVFSDTDEDTLLTSSLTFDFISKCIRFPSKKSVVIVLDCCYSGVAGIRDLSSDVMGSLKKYTGSGTVILTSTGSTGAPTAREDEKLGHGIFTNYLIEGLETGNADKNLDGYISIDELYDYAFEKTKENCSQSPKREGRIEGTFLIGINPQKIKENEYKLRKRKLIGEFSDRLPPDVLQESQNILRKHYGSSSNMEKNDVTILRRLEYLLEKDPLPEKGSDDIQSYIEAVQCLKEKKTIEKQQNEKRHNWNEKEEPEKQEKLHIYTRETDKLKENKKKDQEEIEEIKDILIKVGIFYSPIIVLSVGALLNMINSDVVIVLFLLSLALPIHQIIILTQHYIQLLKDKRENKKEAKEEIEKIKNTPISICIIYSPFILIIVGALLSLLNTSFVSSTPFVLLCLLSVVMSIYYIIRFILRFTQLLVAEGEVKKLKKHWG
jgi:F0F1-type ATP synthase assembly protein I